MQQPRGKPSVRLFAFFMTVLMLVTGFLPLAPVKQVHAGGVGTGSSGSLNSSGSTLGLGGGLEYVGEAAFRVGLNHREELRNLGGTDAQKKEMYTKASSFLPYNYESIYFTPASKNITDFTIGEYNVAGRMMVKMKKTEAQKLVHKLSKVTSKPNLSLKNELKTLMKSDPDWVSKLADGQWKTKVTSRERQEALNMWSYVMYPPSGGTTSNMGASAYDIMPRLQAMVSPHSAQWKTKDLTEDQILDIASGYLSVMMATYKLVPTDNTPGFGKMRQQWVDGIEAFLKTTEEKKALPPWAIVIDPVVVIKWTGKSERMYLSASDFLYFHNAISVTGVLNGKNNLGKDAGNYYDMARKALALDLIAAPKYNRISAKYNSSNAFSHGSSAIDYPGKVLMNIRGTSKWVTSNSQAAFMDTMTYLKSPDGKKVLRGYLTMSFEGLLDDTLRISSETKAGIRIKNVTTEKNVVVPSDQETIGQRNLVTLRMDDLTATTYQTWAKIMSPEFVDNTEKPIDNSSVKVKVELTRTVTPNNAGAPSYSSPLGNITNLTMTRTAWLDFLKGKSTIQIYDDVANDPIAEGSTVKYTYTPKLTVTYKNEKGNADSASTANEDYASYKRPKAPPKYMGYTSTHFENSEIKNETPSNEAFNAMAGVPSNKRLYYAVGGSEFIVDVELERIEKEKSVWRKYHSYFTSVDSEFKAGDTAPTGSIGGHAVNLHGGGTYTKSWSGSIPNNGVAQTTNGSGSVSATSSAVPDRSAYDAAKKEAEAYAKEVNGTVQTHTSASDKVTRSHKGWGAGITTDSSPDPQDVTTSNTCTHTETRGSGKDATTVTINDPCTTTASPSGATSYAITVTFNVPMRIVDGPESTYVLPQVNDTWKTRGEYDYVKIIRANVYKLEAGKLKKTGSVLVDAQDEMNAKIVQGNHTLWFNIAQRNANGNDTEAQSSINGRLRHTLEEGKHDTVVWNEGTRTNKSAGMGANGVSVSPDSGGTIARQGGGHDNWWATKGILYNRTDYANKVDGHKIEVGTKTSISTSVDSLDMATPEWKKFNERRNLKNTTTVVSDFIILQTSSGDQSVMYFDKDAKEVTAQEDFEYVQATREDMWENNPLSSANWTKNSINNGSYNGEFRETGVSCGNNKKFWGMDRNTQDFINNCSGSKVSIDTRLDAIGAGAGAGTQRPARPSAQLLLYETVAIEPTTKNDDYVFDTSQVFYNELLAYKSTNPYKDYNGSVALRDNQYEPKNQADFADKKGLVYDAYYSKDHEKINDIVIHTPVSSEDAMLIASPKRLDQRSTFPPGGAGALIDRDNADRVAFENSQTVPFEFDDAIKRWTTIKTTTKTDVKNDANALLPGFSKTTSKTTVSTTKDYYETGDPNAFQGYTWEQLFGANWRNYVVTTTETSSTVDKSAQVKTEDNGLRYLSRKWVFDRDVEGFTSGTASVSYTKDNLVVKHNQGLTEAQEEAGTITPTEVYFNSPSGLGITNVDKDKDVIEFRMKVVKGGRKVKIQFTTNASTSFTTANTINGTLESVSGVDASGYATYRVALKHDNWKGTINQLRIYLAAGDYSTELNIDHIKIFAGSKDTGKLGASVGQFAFTVLNGLTYNGYHASHNVTIPSTIAVGSTLVLFTANGNDANNVSYKPVVPNDFTAVGSPSNGRQAYTKVATASDVGRTFTISEGGSWGYVLGTVPSGYNLRVVNTNASTVTLSNRIGDAHVVSIVNGATSTSGHTLLNSSYGSLHVYTASFGNASTLNLPIGGLWHSVYNETPHMIFEGTGTGTGATGTSLGTYNYTGGVQTFTAPTSGTYKLETWGAQGGSYTGQSQTPGRGKGGYSSGTISLTAGETLYIYVGSRGTDGVDGSVAYGGWNGGGNGATNGAGGGGGATDIRKGGQALTNRIIVAGGAGGTEHSQSDGSGGSGGGLSGQNAWQAGMGGQGLGGTQTTGYALGQGGPALETMHSSGGGGGYYGGFGGASNGNGGGGSGYIGGVSEGQSIGGNASQPTVTGTGTQNGNSGDGVAKVSLIADTGNDYGDVKDFSYSGSVQSFTAPLSGDYVVETWGAQGGSYSGSNGGKGGYSTGIISLNKGETVYVYVGGSTTTGNGGWNGGGTTWGVAKGGGGATDIRKGGTSLANRIVVAGGGGGAQAGAGGAGGGLTGDSGIKQCCGTVGSGGTQTAGGTGGGTSGTLGQGGNGATGSDDLYAGAGGGGYYGGGGANTDVSLVDDGGGGGGSGYIGGVTKGQTISGNTTQPSKDGKTQTGQTGNGFARVTSLTPDPNNSFQEVITTTKNINKEITEVTERTTVLTDLVKRDIALFPDFMDDKTYNPIKLALGVKEVAKSPLDEPVQTAQGGKINMGTFIVLDREFQIYYPNVGDFAQQPTLRASKDITTTRGLGYVNAMDITQYTDSKYVKFEIDVIFQGVTYHKNTWISLPVEQEYFEFYNVLSNNEASASEIEFHSVAINAPDLVNDNWSEVTNKTRFDDYTAKHGSWKKTYTDVIGRIGNLAITDTDDFRFSNLFKVPVTEDKWIVEGVIKEVNPNKQNKYYGDLIDIRGEDKSATLGLNTYGAQKWLEKPRLSLPINPLDNQATALKTEFLKVGYDIYGNIQTIGNYAEGAVRILPYYYKLEFNDGGDSVKLVPLDVYQQDGGSYKAVNRYGAADNGFVPSDIASYPMVVDWEKEAGRFNYTVDEANVTAKASEAFGRQITGMVENEEMGLTEGVVETLPLMTPNGNYINLGNAQRLVLDSTLRTFIGNTETYGLDKNPGNAFESPLYSYHGQKWYYKIGLPANSVFVKAGTDMVDGDPRSAIEELKQGGGLILMTADIVAIGDVFSLRYNQYGNTNFDVLKDGKEINISLEKLIQEGLQPYLALYDLETSAVIDVETKGSH